MDHDHVPTLRDVHLSDHDRWTELYRAYRAFYRLADDDAAVERTWTWVSTGRHQLFGLVAIDSSGRVVGLANLRRFARPSTGTIGLYLDDLFVDPVHRGIGNATALITEATRLAREEGMSVVRWITSDHNEVARRVYDRVAELTEYVTYDRDPRASAE